METNKNNKHKESFIQGVRNEMKHVQWPTSKQVVRMTITVLASIFVLTLFFTAVNFGAENSIGKIYEKYTEDEKPKATKDNNTTTITPNPTPTQINTTDNKAKDTTKVETTQDTKKEE